MLSRSVVLRACSALAVLALGVVGLTVPAEAAPIHTPTPTLAPTLTATSAPAPAAAAKAKPKPKPKPKPKDPRRTRGLFVDPLMPAYQRGGVYQQRIGSKAQAFWVIPEAYPTNAVRTKVREYTNRANAANKTPMIVVYGIPGRDCGSHSSNGSLQTAREYRIWITQLARGLRRQQALVVLEPDALPLFSSSVNECPTERVGWQGMLRFASKKLTRAGGWVYLDAGHSNWTPINGRPAALRSAGIKWARGISVNVSNFRPTSAEKTYARTVLRGLRKLGIKGKRYVVDTSRNGAKPSADGWDVLNPTWALLGQRPKLVFKGAFDGTLWVKHPGESDGTVNGGPSSGQWCDLLADRLLGVPDTGKTCW